MKQEWRTWNITGRACLGDKVSTIKSNVNKFIEITMSENEYNGNDFPIYVAQRDTLSQELVC